MLHLRKILRRNYLLFKNKVKIIQKDNKIKEKKRNFDNMVIINNFLFRFLKQWKPIKSSLN